MRSQRLNPKEVIKDNRWLLLLFAVSLVVHFFLLIPSLKDSSRLLVWSDSVCYERLALNVLSGNGYSLSASPPYAPNSTMTPGYPLFIAGVYAVFGRSPYAVVVIQILLSLGITAWMIRWGARERSTNAGLLVGLFLLLDLCMAFYSTQLMTDILFLSFLLPAFWLSLKLFEGSGGWKTGVGAGLLLGLGSLVKPIGLYFPLLLAFLFLPTVKKGKWRSRLVGYGLVLVTYVLVITPWFVRNRVVFGHYFISTINSFNLSHQHAAPVKASLEGKTVDEAENDIEKKAYARYGEPRNEAERFIYSGRESLRYISEHPLPYAGIYLAGFIKSLLPVGFGEFLLFEKGHSRDFQNLTPIIHSAYLEGRWRDGILILWRQRIAPAGAAFLIYAFGFAIHLFLIGLAFRGFLIGGFRKPLNLLAFLAGVYFLGVTGPAGQPRHFLPLLPLAALLAANAFVTGPSGDKA